MSVARLAALALIAIGLSAQPASAQTQPAPAPSQAPPAAPADPFGEDVMLTSKTIVFSKGSANWDFGLRHVGRVVGENPRTRSASWA